MHRPKTFKSVKMDVEGTLYEINADPAQFNANDLVADDWEVAEVGKGKQR